MMLKWLWLSAVVIAFDRVTKEMASASLQLHQPVELLPSVNLTLMHNRGAAFSFLSTADGWQRWFFTVIALVVSAVLIAWLRRLDRSDRWLAAALALVIGGALGNVWDRLTLGYVVDFIDLYWDVHHWPAFNVADSAISIGAVILLFDAFRPQRAHRAG